MRVAVQIFLRFQGKKPGIRRKLSRNIGKIKNKRAVAEKPNSKISGSLGFNE